MTHPPVFFFLSPLSLSFSFSPSISLHLLDTLPHQLFSSHTEMTPQGNVILILCVCVCVCVWVYNAHTKCLCAILTCIVFCKFNQPRVPITVIMFRFSYCLCIPKNSSTHFIILFYKCSQDSVLGKLSTKVRHIYFYKVFFFQLYYIW